MRRCAIVLSLLLGSLALAQGPEVLPAKIRTAALFKNGLAMVVRDVTVPAAGEWIVGELPAPVHGSFWLVPPAGAELSATAVNLPRRTPTDALTLVDLLRANLGRAVEIKVDNAWQAGTLRALPEKMPTIAMRQGGRANDYYYYRETMAAAPPVPGFVLLDTRDGQLALEPNQIKGLRGKQLATRYDQAQAAVGVKLKLDKPGPLSVWYLTWGLTWAPSYRLDVKGETASFGMKAMVVNDVEALAATDLQFVTGFPNLRFAQVHDPLALNADVTAFITALSAPQDGTDRYGGVTSQVMQVRSQDSAPPVGPVYKPSAGEQSEDLFFYPQPKVTLDRGERGYYPLFTSDVPCRSLFTWELPDTVDEDYRWRPWWWAPRSSGNDTGRTQSPQIWHVLRLTNTSGVPWTTAPAMMLRDGRIMGQEMLTYTGAGDQVDLRVTRSVDLPTMASESIIKTERAAEHLGGLSYSRLTVKGELAIFNRKAVEAQIEVRKQLQGEIVDTKPTADVRRTAKLLSPINQVQSLVWKVAVPSGARQDIVYTYTVLVLE
ncbi:MAG: hypothetical protein HZB16_13585 [Armatimonadetes bacterium]|nr:hypothetical protein [Armatimonadota bacterium]